MSKLGSVDLISPRKPLITPNFGMSYTTFFNELRGQLGVIDEVMYSPSGIYTFLLANTKELRKKVGDLEFGNIMLGKTITRSGIEVVRFFLSEEEQKGIHILTPEGQELVTDTHIDYDRIFTRNFNPLPPERKNKTLIA